MVRLLFDMNTSGIQTDTDEQQMPQSTLAASAAGGGKRQFTILAMRANLSDPLGNRTRAKSLYSLQLRGRQAGSATEAIANDAQNCLRLAVGPIAWLRVWREVADCVLMKGAQI